MTAPNKAAPPLFGRSRVEVEAALAERDAVACPLCHVEPQPFAVDPQGFSLARCPRCSLEFHSPRPRLDLLAQHVYGREYGDLAAAAGELTEEKHRRFARQLDRLELFLGRPASVLDVGCGAGAFLRAAARRGWQAAGTDIQVSEAARQTGFRLWQGCLREIDFQGRRFHALRFHHVLEHTENPLEELECGRRLLELGGVLYLSVPNLAGLSPRWKSWQSRWGLKSRPWRHYAALHHLWYFTPDTLLHLVKRAGFRVRHWETPVVPKANRPAWLAGLLGWLLETPRLGSILDVYARAE